MQMGEGAEGPAGGAGPGSDPGSETPLEIEVRWHDWRRDPLVGWSWELDRGSPSSGTLPADGIMRFSIDTPGRVRFRVFCPYTRTLQQLMEAGCSEPEFEGVLAIDELELTDEALGMQQRLRNLGYYHGRLDAGLATESSPAAHRLAICVRRYQHDENLAETGELDVNTGNALLAAHDDS